MHMLADCIGLGVLHGRRNLLNAILDQHGLKGTTGEFTTLVKNASERTRIASKPIIIEHIGYVLRASVFNPNHFGESGSGIHDSQCLYLKKLAVNLNGPRANEVGCNFFEWDGDVFSWRKCVLATTLVFVALTSVTGVNVSIDASPHSCKPDKGS
jgi:hypothetical protein